MKRAALVLGLILAVSAWVQHARRYPMVEVVYVSQACEMMGRVSVGWYGDWPPNEETTGRRIEAPIGPDRRCGVVIYVPTHTDEDGRLAATIIGLGDEPVVDTVFSRGVDP